MSTWHLHILGQVQGVGFRPFVYLMAREYGMKGWVNNTLDGVHMEFNSNKGLARVFTKDLIDRAPVLSRITRHELRPAEPVDYKDFSIVHSDAEGEANLLLTPDFNMCNDCREECYTDSDRRSHYPFITCTNCGPRYSIIRKLPYDRHTTTMDSFRMCDACQDEYEDPEDRRYYSQTNSCPACPVRLQLFRGSQAVPGPAQDTIIDKVAGLWKKGKIVAVKGIGGYLLTCDASNEPAVQELRKRKLRPAKPFALMYPSIGGVKKDAMISKVESEELTGPAAPILLLDLKPGHEVLIDSIAPGISRVGVMLPYTPLFELLLNAFGSKVIATSGNISNAPVIYDDQRSREELSGIADYILSNDRDIVVPQDDSVVRYSTHKKQRIVIRRSRGLAPTYLNEGLQFPDETILATGGMLKSTFTFLNRGNCYISQYLGDTDSFDTQEAYAHTTQHFFRMFGSTPEVVLSDRHPQYFSTEEARRLAARLKIPHHHFQHHVAHFAAVLGEHRLTGSEEPILGVIWDGTGYGDDGNIWGGESFIYHSHAFRRHTHLEYFQHILGDKMSVEPRVSLLAAGYGSERIRDLARGKFTEEEWKIYTAMLDRKGDLQTSSVGRLFDAAASLLGLSDKASYEGEAAMYLENLAARAKGYRSGQFIEPYEMILNDSGNWSGVELLVFLLADLDSGASREEAALRFHTSLVRVITLTAAHAGTSKIAFAGGVFQNSVLMDLLIDRLKSGYELYFHVQLSPNDESISFGQLMCYQIGQSGNLQ